MGDFNFRTGKEITKGLHPYFSNPNFKDLANPNEEALKSLIKEDEWTTMAPKFPDWKEENVSVCQLYYRL